jgi:hypothetical protein
MAHSCGVCQECARLGRKELGEKYMEVLRSAWPDIRFLNHANVQGNPGVEQ